MPRRALLLFPLVASSVPCRATASAQAADQGTIEVTVTGVRAHDPGTVIIALYDRPTGWLTTDAALAVRRVPPQGDSLVVTFDNLPFGTGYAVSVLHDRNGNGTLDMRWFPFPKPREGTGVSGNRLRTGPPHYEPARISLAGPLERVRILMRY